MNIILNSLPTKTWNRLNMNESTVTLSGSFANHTPVAKWNDKEVSWNTKADWTRAPEAYGFSPDFTALTAEADTAVASVAAGTVMEEPIVLSYRYEKDEHAVNRLVLRAEEDSVLKAVLLLTSADAEGGDVSALQIEVQAESRAKIELYVAQLTGKESLCLNELGGVCAADAEVQVVRLELGGRKAFTGVSIDLAGQNSKFGTEVGYYAKSGQTIDMNYVALHHGKHTESLMEVNGTMEENAEKVFRGTIDFQKGCAGAKGTENENVLLLGEEMVNLTIPLILCKEEDVEGNHGASIGQLDERILFYLASRGITPENAQQIIARARIQSICSKIPDEEVRRCVMEFEEGMADGSSL